MKILRSSTNLLLTTILIFSIITAVSQSAIGKESTSNPTLEDELGNVTQTKLVHGDSMLILNQSTPKLAYKSGENITISAELTNIGNTTATIGYCEPLVALEIKNQAGDEIWPNSQVACIPEITGKKTLQPGEHISVQPWGTLFNDAISPPRLYAPGKYTAVSVALLTFDINSRNLGHMEPLWSEPLQITVLPEKYVENGTDSSTTGAPEFSFAIPVLLIGITSLIVFYRLNFR